MGLLAAGMAAMMRAGLRATRFGLFFSGDRHGNSELLGRAG